MKISHELPLSLLHYSYEWNDYDYCLPHLLDKYEQYRLFFLKAKKDERFIIMDNGLFEGVFHTNEDLLEKIDLIEPDVFIVPDVWNDSALTVKNAKHWINNYSKNLPKKTKLMAVLQGKTFGELITTYQTLVDLGYSHIAFNHSSEAYQKIPFDIGKEKKQVAGRHYLINKLLETNTMMNSYYHHLLGCSLAHEFALYKNKYFDYGCLKSVDTSNPIIAGAKGLKYSENGLNEKPSEKIEEFFEKGFDEQIDLIKFNVETFKKIVK